MVLVVLMCTPPGFGKEDGGGPDPGRLLIGSLPARTSYLQTQADNQRVLGFPWKQRAQKWPARTA